jgi:hypothetical protein
MGKVSLTKKNKSDRGADFKRRKSNLGHGKHKQLSHTKIDLRTAPLKIPTQSKFENVESEPAGPNLSQLQDLILLCHSDNGRKVLQGLTALASFLPKSSDLFVQNASPILSATLHHLRDADAKIQEAARTLVQWIFSRHAQSCVPFISVFVRHVSAAIASPAPAAKLQSAFLLDRIGTLPNLLPIPSLFETFPIMIRSATTVPLFGAFAQAITRLLKRFVKKAESAAYSDCFVFQFPRLFPPHSTACSHRFQPHCLLGADEIEAVDSLMQALEGALPLLEGESQGAAVADLCALLLVLYRLQPSLSLAPFLTFVGDRFPYEELSIPKNVVIAKFLLNDRGAHDAIRRFLCDVEVSAETIVLFATLGGFEDLEIPAITEAVQELCEAQIADSAAPAIANALLDHVRTAPKPTKRCLRALISLRKGGAFLDRLFEVLTIRLAAASPAQADLLLALLSSCAPLPRDFLRNWALFLVSDEVEEGLCKRGVEAVAVTSGSTDDSCLISFLMTIGARRPLLRDFARVQIRRLELLANPDARPLFHRLDLDAWTIQ